MPQFHFNVIDGVAIMDEDGVELPSIREARRQAVWLAGDLLRQKADVFWQHADWRMEVSDEHGAILFTIQISGHEPVSEDHN